MVEFVNDTYRKENGLIVGNFIAFTKINTYYAGSLQDFVDNRNSLQATPWYRVLPPAVYSRGSALLIIRNCRYRFVAEPDHRKINGEFIARKKELIRVHELELPLCKSTETREYLSNHFEEELLEIRKNAHKASCDAELYDSDLVYPVRTNERTFSGRLLPFALLLYRPKVDFAYFIGSIEGPTRREKLTLADLLDKLTKYPELLPT